eukprot:TRINITY_DN18103_c0_g1_i1.p1 TRINITY_DN18103_c0_g1~~TRINITY_DN18103_c0_g1_i1.p1  ORF type:complete len:515 (+),score=170.21 TRINITY_DN18103_c0_g1_i1:34-1578(+)
MELPDDVEVELEKRIVALSYRYCLTVVVTLTEEQRKLGIVPLYDKRGSIKFGSSNSLVKSKLEEMGVDPEQFMKSQPILYTIGYENNEVACGGLVEPHINDLVQTIQKNLPVHVRLTFYASEQLIPDIPLNCKLDMGMHFVKHTGVVVTDLQPGSKLARLQLQANSNKGGVPSMVCPGTRITAVNKRRIHTQDPEASFKTQFAQRMLNDPEKAGTSYSLTVQMPLFVDPNPTSAVLLFDKILEEAHRALVYVDWNSELTKHGGIMLKTFLEDSLLKKAASTYKATRASLLQNPDVVAWCYTLLDDAIRQYCSGGSLSRDITLNVAEFKEDLVSTVAFKDSVVKQPRDKLVQMRYYIKKEMKLVSGVVSKKRGSVRVATDASQQWMEGLWLKCPKCNQVGAHNHLDAHVIYGNIFRVDTSKVCPGTFFLDKVDWQSWDEVDIIYPSRMHPDKLPYIKGSGMDVRFRAVLTTAQFEAFQTKVRDLGDSEQRHFKWDQTGQCVRQKWSWEAPKRKHE